MASCRDVMLALYLLFYIVAPGECAFRNFEPIKTIIPIGAIFPPNKVAEVAFASALTRASMESKHYHYVLKVVYSPYGDSFSASRAACDLLSSGVVAIFGPTDVDSAAAVEARCRAAGVPHIQAVWRPSPVRGIKRETPPGINLFPEAVSLSKAVALHIKDSDWNFYVLLYDDDHGLKRLQEILKHADPKHKWFVRRLKPGEDNRPLFKTLKSTGATRVVIDCPADRVLEYLRQANEVKFFEDYMSYILMSLDAHTLNLEELRYVLSNVTCFRIFDHTDSRTRSYLADWKIRGSSDVEIPKTTHEITVEAALASDAASLITDAVENIPEGFQLEAETAECGSDKQWEQGEKFWNHLLTNPVNGITNKIIIDNTTGERTYFDVEIMELSKNGFNSIAKWNSNSSFTYARSAVEVSDILAEKWQNKTFRVVSRIGAPYLIEKIPKEGEELIGNDRYEGYSKDLIHEILAESLHLSYEIIIVPGNLYGSYNKETKTWDGLVGYLLERKADLAICDLTITYERRSSVDFTTPFMTLGISILYSKPTPPPPELFSFLKPFSVDVWIYMGAAYLMVSLLLHILARLAPKDWENPHPCDKSPEELENIWHIKNSCWLTMGSIMTQGSDILPKGYSTRWVCGMWWFFALIMCSSYTANLAAFLTNAAMDDSIKSAEDLAMQTKIKYGTVQGGSTFSFFKRSNVSTYQKMWGAMESARPSVFVKNNDEGVERVLKSKKKYAFLMESTAIEYQLERHCDLMQVGTTLDSKGYGIAMPFDSTYRTAVDNAVLKLAESGKLVELKNRWWKVPKEKACVSEEAGEEGASAEELGVDNVGGVFVVLGIGCGMAAAMGGFEFLWHVREVAIEQKMSQTDAFWAELAFALSFWETEKPVVHSRPSSSRSGSIASRASSVLRSAADLFHLDVFLRINGSLVMKIPTMPWCILFCYLLIQQCNALISREIKNDVTFQIGGIFENGAITQRLAFDDSMKDASVDDFRLEPIIIQQSRPDIFSTWKDLCSSQTIQPIAIFGPQSSSKNAAVNDQCAILKIPHLQASWQPQIPDLTAENNSLIAENNTETKEQEENVVAFKKISINFFPNSDEISVAYAALLKYYKWENFAALYEDEYGLMRIQKILAENTYQYPVTVRQLEPDGDNYKVFKELQNSQETRFFIDCHVDNVLKYMDIINMLNLDDFYQHYIFSTMDTSIVAHKLTDFRANITWLSVTEYDKLIDAQHFLAQRVERWTINTVSPPVTDMPLEALLMNDVANHVVKALTTLEKNTSIQKPPTFSCEPDTEGWEYGALLQQEILKTQTTGVSGNIQFDEMGQRKNYVLYVNEIHLKKRQTIGKWESSSGGQIIEDRPDADIIINQQTRKHFYVISRKAKPYFYEKEKCTTAECEEEDDGEEYEGFSVDLVKQIFETLRKENFNYTYSFKHDMDYKYGHYDKDKKKWDGLIGDLLDKKADLAVCDLTITEERKKVVDFSVPFMSLGISILYVQEKTVDPGMFSFLNPYTFEVWMYIATAYCVVSIVLFVCSRISPADWENPQPCDKDPEELENIWNFKNCTWLTMGSIMTQGCDILPKAIGTRWVCSMWWFFAVIVCQTYIAQLSASMTSALENEPINSVEDLANQNKILYGALDGGSTLSFFKNSNDKMYQRMYDNMIANKVVLVVNNDEGEKRVINGKGKYAFFMESVTIEYKLKRNCDLKKVGGELDSKDYGIAMPANSPFRTDINRAILKLKESNALDKIKRKWWESKYGAISCYQEEDKNDVEGDLEIKNLIGAFVVLIVGLVLALFITAAEFMNEVRNIVVRERVTHKEVFMKELKASLNFFQLQKPVLRNPSRAPSVASSIRSLPKTDKEKRSNGLDAFLEFEKNPQ
ncbi:uncharacterized protein [Battus philenor]|uniref:uncharacterized protein n=1 Tax=Battus philenor TaxID=42288 RepID=UPI0035CE9F36